MNNQPQPATIEEFPNFVIFKIDNAKVNIDVFFHNETLWLMQKQFSELDKNKVYRNFRHTTQCCTDKSVISKMETTCNQSLQVQRIA